MPGGAAWRRSSRSASGANDSCGTSVSRAALAAARRRARAPRPRRARRRGGSARRPARRGRRRGRACPGSCSTTRSAVPLRLRPMRSQASVQAVPVVVVDRALGAAQPVLERGADAAQLGIGEQHPPLHRQPGPGGQRQHAAEQLRHRPGRAGRADVQDARAAQRRRGVLKRLHGPAAGQRRVVARSARGDGHRLQVGGHGGSVLRAARRPTPAPRSTRAAHLAERLAAQHDLVAVLEERARRAVGQLDRLRPGPRQLEQAAALLALGARDRARCRAGRPRAGSRRSRSGGRSAGRSTSTGGARWRATPPCR